MSPFSMPVLGGAALVSSPALWRAIVEGTTSTEVALTRYLVSVVICWMVLAFVAMLVGPAPKPATPAEAEVEAEAQAAEEPAPVR
ncbi:MAG TPA: hypothetical protein VLB29_14040 [Nocardioidaceae bacterium]|nr:hypothetical protein [Nocardioidaceae bacterium]